MNKRLKEIEVLYNDGVNVELLNRLLNVIDNELNEYEKIYNKIHRLDALTIKMKVKTISDSNSDNVVDVLINRLHIDSDGEINSIGSQFG